MKNLQQAQIIKIEKDKLEEHDHLMAVRLQQEENQHASPTRSKRTTSRPTKVTKATKATKKQADARAKSVANTVFNAPHLLSPALLELIGATHLSRPQVVKQLWQYIKEHELQDDNDKRKINCDSKMLAVFRKKSVNMFEMNRLISDHLFKSDEVTSQDSGVNVSNEVLSDSAETSETSEIPEIPETSKVSLKTENEHEV